MVYSVLLFEIVLFKHFVQVDINVLNTCTGALVQPVLFSYLHIHGSKWHGSTS